MHPLPALPPVVPDASDDLPYLHLTRSLTALVAATAQHADQVSHLAVYPDSLWWQARGQVQGMYAAWRVAVLQMVAETDPQFIEDDAALLHIVGGLQ